MEKEIKLDFSTEQAVAETLSDIRKTHAIIITKEDSCDSSATIVNIHYSPGGVLTGFLSDIQPYVRKVIQRFYDGKFFDTTDITVDWSVPSDLLRYGEALGNIAPEFFTHP